MGWFNSDHPGHEGHLVALVPVGAPLVHCQRGFRRKDTRHLSGRRCPRDKHGAACDPLDNAGGAAWRQWLFREPWRELGSDDNVDVDDIRRIQVACDCGWRSQVYSAPVGTYFVPHSVEISGGTRAHQVEDELRALWHHHLAAPKTSLFQVRR